MDPKLRSIMRLVLMLIIGVLGAALAMQELGLLVGLIFFVAYIVLIMPMFDSLIQ